MHVLTRETDLILSANKGHAQSINSMCLYLQETPAYAHQYPLIKDGNIIMHQFIQSLDHNNAVFQQFTEDSIITRSLPSYQYYNVYLALSFLKQKVMENSTEKISMTLNTGAISQGRDRACYARQSKLQSNVGTSMHIGSLAAWHLRPLIHDLYRHIYNIADPTYYVHNKHT